MKKIYFVGSPTIAKGIEEFNELALKFPYEKFYWFCYHVPNEIKEKYKKINFMVAFNDKKMYQLIKNEMDILASLSKYEGFCLPIAEALILEKSVISYDLAEIRSTYGDSLEYVPCFNFNYYTQKIKSLIRYNKPIQQKHLDKKYILDNYSPKSISIKLIGLLTDSR